MKEIAIIGGGIAGLTLSLCLKNENIKCHIFEKKDEFKEVGAAISVFPNALRVYQKIGILNEVLKLSGEFKEVFLKTKEGVVLSTSKPQYELPTICMHRVDLHDLLLEKTEAALYTNHALVNCEEEENGKVKVYFKNGVFKTFDAVIGADGLHSKVREIIKNDGKPIFRGYNIWRGVCESTVDIGYGSETYGEGKRVGIVPIKDGKFGWWATFNEDFLKDDEPEGAKAKLRRLFGDWHFPIPELIENTDHILKNSLCDREPSKGWSKGKTVLLGDAAHPTTPNLGQGACMAIEGAYILSECINKYDLSEKAFKKYESLHFKRAKEITETSLLMGKMGQIENAALIKMRNFLFKSMPDSVSMKMIDKYFSYDVTKLKY
jgi:2-polyprenyl-6-methoxyphenol hydroxylase-like FAD-dependent oxidoreductase